MVADPSAHATPFASPEAAKGGPQLSGLKAEHLAAPVFVPKTAMSTAMSDSSSS